MNNFLLIDFGASRVKSAITDIKNGFFSDIKDYPSPRNISQKPNNYEVSLLDIKKQFLSICNFYFNKLKINFEGIMVCSQMHGFALLDKNNKPITNYISWKDERSLETINDVDTFNLLNKQLVGNFKKITGMKPRPGFPFFNSIHIAKKLGLKQVRVITLPDWLSLACDDSNFLSHDSMLAGLGFFDIAKRQTSNELLKLAKQFSGADFFFNLPAGIDEISGYWHNGFKKIPIFLGVGDHQCAVLGAGNLPNKSLSINIGTGSQVSVIKKKIETDKKRVFPHVDYAKILLEIPV